MYKLPVVHLLVRLLRLHLHAVAQVDRELADVAEGVLVGGGVVEGEELGRGVLHEGDGGEGVRVGGLAGLDERHVGALQDAVEDSVVRAGREMMDGEESGDADAVFAA